jgi:hypothetical protein
MPAGVIRPSNYLAFAATIILPFVAAVDCGAAEPMRVNGWILNDLAAAQKEARQSGKPIFVTFRCEA